MENHTILVVDDEEHILELIEYNLYQNQFHALTAQSGEEALALLEKEKVDLVLLDWMLPGMSGIDVLKEIRKDERLGELPVILLTAKGEEIDKVLGLELGADDYISKPFGIHELMARVKAVLRRSIKSENKDKEDYLILSDIKIDRISREVFAKGVPVELSLKEFELLYFLGKNKGRVFTRDQLLEYIWGYDYFGETRTVDVHVRNIRKKLEEAGIEDNPIKTVRGIGYKYQE
ncbi:MAG: response regulator [Lachnospiraceae bacterium]